MMPFMMNKYAPFAFISLAVVGKRAFCDGLSVTTTAVPELLSLQSKLKEIESLNGVKNLLGWDEMVMLAPGSSTSRNNQKSILASVIHGMETSKELETLIGNLVQKDLSSLDPYEKATIRDAARDFAITSRKSKDMAMKEAELEGRGYQIWADARSSNDFSKFEPVLREIVDLKKEIALTTRPNMSAYDGNIDMFERGMTTQRLDDILGTAKTKLIPLIKELCQSDFKKQYSVPDPLKGGNVWSVDLQAKMCRQIAESIGFDFDKGRLDVSVHPFTGGSHPTDVRITTRYSTDSWIEGVSGTVHEVGHALYEQGRSAQRDDLPISRALSMGVHESQSLFWERMVFQSSEFWVWATPILHEHFPHTKSCTPEDLYRFVNQVEPSLIRIEADEVTYPIHILLRFELERGLFSGAVDVNDLPKLWKEKMSADLGVAVPDDSKGVLQDIHWSIGALGYFPSYTIGAMMAAQLFEALEKEMPDVRAKIARGEFNDIREWLRIKIHDIGSLYDNLDDLLVSVTGKPLDPQIYVDYLENKYRRLYKI